MDEMEAFCGKWRMDREGCEGERQFYEADDSISDPCSLILDPGSLIPVP